MAQYTVELCLRSFQRVLKAYTKCIVVASSMFEECICGPLRSQRVPTIVLFRERSPSRRLPPPSSLCPERQSVYHHLGDIFKFYVYLLMNSEQASLVIQVFHVAPVVPQGLVLLLVQEVHVPLGVQLALGYLPVL